MKFKNTRQIHLKYTVTFVCMTFVEVLTHKYGKDKNWLEEKKEEEENNLVDTD